MLSKHVVSRINYAQFHIRCIILNASKIKNANKSTVIVIFCQRRIKFEVSRSKSIPYFFGQKHYKINRLEKDYLPFLSKYTGEKNFWCPFIVLKLYGDACQNLGFWENSRVRKIKLKILALQSFGTVALHNLKNFQVFPCFLKALKIF